MIIVKGKREIIIILCSILFSTIGCNNQKNNKANSCELFADTYKSIKSKNSSKADTMSHIKTINYIIEKDSNCLDAFITRADLYVGVDSLILARNDYLKSLSFDPKNTYVFYQLGILWHLNNNEDSAIYFFEKAISTKKNNDTSVIVDYHTINKNLSSELDKYDIFYDEIVFQMAISYYYKRDIIQAIKNFNICIADQYNLSKVFIYRGAIYCEMNKPKFGCEDFSMAKKLGNMAADEYIKKYCSSIK
jgi:tetratricopeptide (TPR) repeat protein